VCLQYGNANIHSLQDKTFDDSQSLLSNLFNAPHDDSLYFDKCEAELEIAKVLHKSGFIYMTTMHPIQSRLLNRSETLH